MTKTYQTQVLAKKYASSLFEYILKAAGNTKELPMLPYYTNTDGLNTNITSIFQAIRTLQYLLITNQELNSLFSNPGYSIENKLEILSLILPDLNPVLRAFIQVLADRNQLSLLEIIFDIFNSIYNNFTGIKYIKIVTRVPLAKEQKTKLRKFLKQKCISSSCSSFKIVIDYIISDKLLGGIILIDGLSIIDNSLQNKVQNLLKML